MTGERRPFPPGTGLLIIALTLAACSSPASDPAEPDAPDASPAPNVPSGDIGRHEGDLRVDGRIWEINGEVAGTLTVGPTASLYLYGEVLGDVVVEAGGEAQIFGTVGGTLVNHGGPVVVLGRVGAIRDEEGSLPTNRMPGAIIGGVRVP